MRWSAVGPALAGAIAQEVLHWYRLRERLGTPRLRALWRSPGYWLVTLAMIVVSGFGADLLYGARLARPDAMFLIGAAFPMILKRAIAVTGRSGTPATGAPATPWRDYLDTA